MPQYYNPKRKSDWNYGGFNWKLSRSKIDLFVECPRCFYIDNKLGTKRPGGFPFNLNTAVDTLLKKEFDTHRVGKSVHPLLTEYGVDAIPFSHTSLNEWRDNFKGVTFFHKDTGFTVSGAIDDLWVNKKGELHVVDYKATSKDEKVSIDADWQQSYKRQMEVYQWLLRKNNFEVSDTGYFVYVNGRTDLKAFDKKLEFDVDLIPYEGDTGWVEDTLYKIKETLDTDELPKSGENCEFCPYFYTRQEYEK